MAPKAKDEEVEGALSAPTLKEWVTQENCYSLHRFPAKPANFSKVETAECKFTKEEYQEYLRLESNNMAQTSAAPRTSID